MTRGSFNEEGLRGMQVNHGSTKFVVFGDFRTSDMSKQHPVLEDIEALFFDVFGTVVDWLGSVSKDMKNLGKDANVDWTAFTKKWREGYITETARIAKGGDGPTNIDVLHREILDKMLQDSAWNQLSELWSEEEKRNVVLTWHRLDGWPDSSRGLHKLKKFKIISTLSNGNVRLLVDMAKHADLPWDVIMSGEIFQSYKPDPKVYTGAAQYLDLPPEKCAMVAAHVRDLEAAAKCGFRTIYVRRATEDTPEQRAGTKSKADGGTVDVTVDSLTELADLLSWSVGPYEARTKTEKSGRY